MSSVSRHKEGKTSPFDNRGKYGVVARINPKAILTWVAIMSVALKPDAAALALPMIIFGCAVICVVVLCGYALLFSTAVMSAFY